MNERQKAILEIQQTALQVIQAHYADFPYHNSVHTGFVIETANLLAQDAGLPQDQLELLTLMAAAHDLIQAHDPLTDDYLGENEHQSADWLIEQMHIASEFEEDEIEQARRGIEATFIRHREDGIKQSAEFGDFLSELLCDADLANLGSPWEIYFPKTKDYFKEINPQATDEDWKHYLRLQIPILRQHHYYTTVAQERFHHLRENATKIEALLNP
ncbi:hypothetical protein HOM98_04315 [Candidatus Peregrinibacteria bacterium]|jgi:hypothetical protein|nr:hypothetical protein [Candidatus Peregrinibacteria bacterium]